MIGKIPRRLRGSRSRQETGAFSRLASGTWLREEQPVVLVPSLARAGRSPNSDSSRTVFFPFDHRERLYPLEMPLKPGPKAGGITDVSFYACVLEILSKIRNYPGA